MIASTESTADFREQAEAASVYLVRDYERRQGRPLTDPLDGGFSCCVPVPGDGKAMVRTLKSKTIVALVLGFAGLGGGALLISRVPDDAPPIRFILPILCSLGGFAMLLHGQMASRRMVRSLAADRLSRATGGGTPPVFVSIEDAATCEKMKGSPEDVGAVILFPAGRCIRIEGLIHRYRIQAADVVSTELRKTPSSRALLIRYRIGPAELHLAVFDNRLVTAFRRRFGLHEPLYRKIQQVLTDQEMRTTSGV